jgi:dTDP-4-amino-4,6-dideoxygalactose transaminase
MAQALANGHISGDGPFTKKCHELLTSIHKCAATLLTTSCTHALEMSALLLDIKPGDEVILPSFTFVSTANAFVLRGARPVFVDVRADTLNLDETQLEALITPRTRAIEPVQRKQRGAACDMER